jgi:hypothetical protein
MRRAVRPLINTFYDVGTFGRKIMAPLENKVMLTEARISFQVPE